MLHKSNHGGARSGAGRKKGGGSVCVRVPLGCLKDVTEIISAYKSSLPDGLDAIPPQSPPLPVAYVRKGERGGAVVGECVALEAKASTSLSDSFLIGEILYPCSNTGNTSKMVESVGNTGFLETENNNQVLCELCDSEKRKKIVQSNRKTIDRLPNRVKRALEKKYSSLANVVSLIIDSPNDRVIIIDFISSIRGRC